MSLKIIQSSAEHIAQNQHGDSRVHCTAILLEETAGSIVLI
jgi:hypothetical protein